MGYDKTKLLSNIRVISLAIKNIEKGFCKSNPVNYIMDVYEMDMRTSVDVCKLDHDIIDIVLDHVNNNTNNDEEALILFLQENKITKPIINYILDRDDDVSDDDCEYTVKIVYDDLIIEKYKTMDNDYQHIESFYEQINYYTICDNVIKINNELKLRKIRDRYASMHIDTCKSLNICEIIYDDEKNNHTRRVCTKLTDNEHNHDHTLANVRRCGRCNIPDYKNNSPKFLRIWHPTTFYSTDNKYLIFNSRNFVPELHSVRTWNCHDGTTRSSNIYNFKLDNALKNDNDIIKIPLIDGLRMKTPIGFASVKKTITIDEYLTVCKWTDNDFDNYSK